MSNVGGRGSVTKQIQYSRYARTFSTTLLTTILLANLRVDNSHINEIIHETQNNIPKNPEKPDIKNMMVCSDLF